MTFRTPLLVVAALMLVTASAQAAVIVYLPLDDLVRNADAVVHGKVLKSQAFKDASGERIYTRHTVQVKEYLNGKGDETVSVVTMGGELEDIGQLVPGEARLTVGEEVVLVLAKAQSDYVVYNMAQGQFALRLEKDVLTVTQQLKGLHFVGRKVTPTPVTMPLDDFRKVVRKVSQ